MRPTEPGETAVRLPWLSPGTAALVTLARSGLPDAWNSVRDDPGAVLLLAPVLADETISIPSTILDKALTHLTPETEGFVDWARPDVAPVLRAAWAFARIAELLARKTGECEPLRAWAGGLLASLGWMAVAAVEPAAVGDCLREPVYADELPEVQRHLWRLDAAAIARRLARRWHLPDWLRFIVGDLGLSADAAEALSADGRLFRVVQLAASLAQATGHQLGIAVGTPTDDLLESLGLTTDDVNAVLHDWRRESVPALDHWTDPRTEPVLPHLLAVAREKRRLEEGPSGEALEREIDRLHEALLAQRATETDRLHCLKLRAMAELAAGAGHEINNPLAVISGQSQYLLAKESDPERQKSLQTIIRQSERIHEVLRDMMQFARPPQPRRQSLDLRAVIADVLESNRPRAEAKAVALEFTPVCDSIPAYADPAMIRTALSNLIRNAIEAAPSDGWVRVTAEPARATWQIAVEDSGAGPDQAQHEHLFDPFYSGRNAGRGRGLGLSTAWRMARENGGDVRFDPIDGRPARFVLHLPKANPFHRDEMIPNQGATLKIA